MELGVRVEAENLITGKRRHTASAYLTFVAIDGNGRPLPLSPLVVETDEEKRRNREASDRRKSRLPEKTKEKQYQNDLNCPELRKKDKSQKKGSSSIHDMKKVYQRTID